MVPPRARAENPRVGSSILPLAIRRDPSLPANRRSCMVDPNEQAVVVVRGRGDGFAQEITAGRHRLIADEPVSAGGTARGLGPYDLLLAGLGAWTSMTIALYARRKGGPVSGVTVRL